MPVVYTLPRAASCLNVSEETVRGIIRAKRLKSFAQRAQWFIPRRVLPIFANSYDPKTDQEREIL